MPHTELAPSLQGVSPYSKASPTVRYQGGQRQDINLKYLSVGRWRSLLSYIETKPLPSSYKNI